MRAEETLKIFIFGDTQGSGNKVLTNVYDIYYQRFRCDNNSNLLLTSGSASLQTLYVLSFEKQLCSRAPSGVFFRFSDVLVHAAARLGTCNVRLCSLGERN